MLQRVKEVQESDLRMDGALARNIQRVIAVTQADIDTAAALGEGWVVWKVIEVNDPIDNLRGGTQLVIKQNSITPGQNVRRVLIVSGPGGETVVVSGSDYIVLPDAVANSLSYVKAYGGTEQNGTPTPDAPVDIVSNNGVLRIQGSATGTVTQTGNPTPTTPVEPEFYQNHGLLLRAIGTDADAYDASTQTITRAIGYHIFDGTEIFGTSNAYGNALYISSASVTWGANRNKDVLCQYFLGASSPSSSMPEFTCFFNATGHFYFRTTETATDFKAWLAELYANGTPLILWFVNSTPETESFTPSVYADGTVETINAHGKNLFDVNNPYKSGYAITQNGSETSVPSFSIYSLKVEPLTTYTYSCNYTESVTTRIHSYDKNGNWIQQDTYGNANATKTFTTTSNTTEIRISINNTAALSTQFELGSTATAYEPYYDGGTATAEMLLKIGDYTDVQEILSGAVTRNVGIKVLDGTENWVVASVSSVRYILLEPTTDSNRYDIISSHFKSDPVAFANMSNNSGCLTRIATEGKKAIALKAESYATLNDWTQYLADQYAAGTPVIVVYPLATPTTESVTGQTLQVQAGDNTLEITQASLDNLELEAEYTKTA